MVFRSVPLNATVIGVPGRIIKTGGERVPEETIENVNISDPVAERFYAMEREIIELRKKLENPET